MNSPFFSIVIPTRNRAEYLKDTVLSATGQRFNGFEVIVSDNSTNDESEALIQNASLRKTVSYIRPSRPMSMPEHWEFATSRASGRYVLVLTDRSVLKQGALATIHKYLSSFHSPINVCSWRWSLYDERSGMEYDGVDSEVRGEQVRLMEASEVEASFNLRKSAYPFSLPRGLNSCYSSDIAASIRARYGRLFTTINPDFTSAFALLANSPTILHIDYPLFISTGLGVSNGGAAYISDATPYLKTLGLSEWYRNVPIKSPLVENIIFEDFLAMRNLDSGSVKRSGICWKAYFLACYKELLEKRNRAVLPKSTIDAFFIEWRRALSGFDERTQKKVAWALWMLLPLQLKLWVRGSPMGPFLQRIALRARGRSLNGDRIDRSILYAAGFEEAKDAERRDFGT